MKQVDIKRKKMDIQIAALIVISVLLFMSLSTLISLAWFASNDKSDNALHLGDAVHIEFITNELTGEFDIDIPSDRILPGLKISPDVSISVKKGSTAVVLRVKVGISVAGDNIDDKWLEQELEDEIKSSVGFNGNLAWHYYNGWFYFIGDASTGTYEMTKTLEGVGGDSGSNLIPENGAQYVASSNRGAQDPESNTVMGSIYSGNGNKTIYFLDPLKKQTFQIPGAPLGNEYANVQIKLTFKAQAIQDFLIDLNENSIIPTIGELEKIFNEI